MTQVLAVAEEIWRQEILVYKNDNEVACTLSQDSLGLLFYHQGKACTDLLMPPCREDLCLGFNAANPKIIIDLWVMVHWVVCILLSSELFNKNKLQI